MSEKLIGLQPRHTLENLEHVMLGMEQADCPVIHHFGDGIYIREVRMKAGTFAIGHHQNFDHMNIFIAGKVQMYLEDGNTRILQAPMTFIGKPGRKVGLILEDVIWQNVYATHERDVDKLETHFLTKSAVWTNDHARRLEQARTSIPRLDYNAVLAEFGISHETASDVSQNTEDRIDLPLSVVRVAPSQIDGFGLFASVPFKNGDFIMQARINGRRTQGGRFTNHSNVPNARMVLREDGDIDLVAIADISGCKGGQLGDEILIDYRDALKLSGLEPLCQQ